MQPLSIVFAVFVSLVSCTALAEEVALDDVRVTLPDRATLPSSPGFFALTVTVHAGQEQFPMSLGLFLPPGYFTSKDAFPVVVALHNRGIEGSGGYAVTAEGIANMWVHDAWDEREKAVGPGADAIMLRKSARFIGVAPQCPKGRAMQIAPIPQAISKLVDELGNVYRIDQERVYLTGFSWGGSNTWLVAEQTPDRYAAIVPVSFKAPPDPQHTVATLLHLSVYMACGGADLAFAQGANASFVQFAAQMNQAMQAGHHPDFVLRMVPNGSHFCYGAIYTDPAFWDWLFARKRKPRPATQPVADTPAHAW